MYALYSYRSDPSHPSPAATTTSNPRSPRYHPTVPKAFHFATTRKSRTHSASTPKTHLLRWDGEEDDEVGDDDRNEGMIRGREMGKAADAARRYYGDQKCEEEEKDDDDSAEDLLRLPFQEICFKSKGVSGDHDDDDVSRLASLANPDEYVVPSRYRPSWDEREPSNRTNHQQQGQMSPNNNDECENNKKQIRRYKRLRNQFPNAAATLHFEEERLEL